MNGCKFYKQKKQVSYDNGVTWIDVTPAEYRKGELYESHSSDCGYATRTISGSPYCSGETGYDKYIDVYSQESYDNGETWTTTATTPSLIEINSVDCGYIPPHDYSQDYLTITALGNGRISFRGTYVQDEGSNFLAYSKDSGETWTQLASSGWTSVVTGQEVWFKGECTPVYESIYGSGIGYFTTTMDFNVKGNTMSLLWGNDFRGKTAFGEYGTGSWALAFLFRNSRVINAENLVLPATILRGMCYYGMFEGCSQLVSIPSLSAATTLTGWCYHTMFKGCTSLSEVPSNYLPSTTLGEYCYYGMFEGCTSLTTAPDLPASGLELCCYEEMFSGCSSLNYIKCLAINFYGQSCTPNWLYGVSSTGTFVKASSMSSWPSGSDGIPSGWTVQNAT